MIQKLKQLSGIKMLLIGLVVGGVVAAPLGVNALTSDKPEVEAEATVTVDPAPESGASSASAVTEVSANIATPVVADETPVVIAPENPTVPVEPGEGESDAPATVADLQAAIAIAAPEHEGVEVVSARVKTLGAETVYKVVFADGWIVYVSADDGEVLVIKDALGKKHAGWGVAKARWMAHHRGWDPKSGEWRDWSNQWLTKQNWEAMKQKWQAITPSTAAETEARASVSAGRNHVGSEARASYQHHNSWR